MFNRILALALFLTGFAPAAAQECALGVGGRDNDLIVQVFQLNEDQQTRLEQWTAELEAENAVLQEKARELLATHPQGTTDEVETLGAKYREIKEAVLANSLRYDRYLLGTFNEKQYQTYVELCREVVRTPMAPASPEPGG